MFPREIHQKQMRIIWLGMLAGMIALSVVALGIFFIAPESIHPMRDYRVLDQAVMTAIVILVVINVLIKRNLFVADKLLNTFRKKVTSTEALWQLCLLSDRKYRFILWVMSECVALLAFIIFVFSGNMQLFGIYMLAGLYLMAVNYPTGRFLDRCQYLLESKGG